MCKSNETFGNQPVKWCELLIVNPSNTIPAFDQTSGTFSILNEVFPFFTIHQSNVFFFMAPMAAGGALWQNKPD